MDGGRNGAAGRGTLDAEPALWLGVGARSVETAVLAAAAAPLDAVREAPALLAAPVRVVVPSRSLREHWIRRLVGHRGAAVAGLQVQTLYGAALEILDRTGRVPSLADVLLPVVVRQLAEDEPVLRRSLGDLVDGYGVVEATVSDLLDAGLEPSLVGFLEERLREVAAFPAQLELARAVVRVAARTLGALAERGLAHRSQLLLAARDALEADPETALPTRALLVHGFAEATGVASELLEALARHRGAQVFVEAPPSPGADPDEARGRDPHPFTRRLVERLAGVSAVRWLPAARSPASPSRPPIEVLEAPGATGEARAVALRVRALLDDGALPEEIAITARDLRPYTTVLRTQLARLGIPFSGVGATAVSGGPARRLAALLTLLRVGPDCLVDRWLDADPLPGTRGKATRAWHASLRLGLRHLGAARIRDAARLEPEPGDLRLPVRHGLQAGARDDEGGAEDVDEPELESEVDANGQLGLRLEPGPAGAPAHPFAARRRLDAGVLQRAIGAARAVVVRMERWPARGAFARHLAFLRGLVRDDLGWDTVVGRDAVDAWLAELETSVPPDFPLSRDEFVLLCGRTLAARAEVPLGGEGGGVQVLGVMEARGRTFEHLFVLGLDRDVFPRLAREDPLLGDGLRRALRDLLPDLPVKGSSSDEESFLFAQALAAAPGVVLTHQRVSDDSRARSPSTFLQRIPAERRTHLSVPALHERPEPAAQRIARPAREHALHAALFADAEAFAAQFAVAVAAGRGDDAGELAAGRLAVLREIDRAPGPGAALGPYDGFVGPPREPGDLRYAPSFVTGLEGQARCPWRHFVEKMLRVEVTPDPVEALPDVDALLLGSVVHGVLEEIAVRTVGRATLDGVDRLATLEPGPLPWPDESTVEAIVRDVVRREMSRQGFGHSALGGVVARRVAPFLANARRSDWAEGGPPVVGAEVSDVLTLEAAGSKREIHFRVDRVDRTHEGLRLTDYKTGKVGAKGLAQEAARRRRRVVAVARGELLQAFAYALASGDAGRGRYLYLQEDHEAERMQFEVDTSDEELDQAFRRAVEVLFAARDLGAFTPRLFEGAAESPLCRWCHVAEACVRGDSGARGRLESWHASARASAPAEDVARASLDVLDLGRRS